MVSTPPASHPALSATGPVGQNPAGAEASPRPGGSRGLGRFWPLAIPLVAMVELVAHMVFAHRAATPAQWEKAKPAAEAWHQKGEPVVVAPYWAEPMARWKW